MNGGRPSTQPPQPAPSPPPAPHSTAVTRAVAPHAAAPATAIQGPFAQRLALVAAAAIVLLLLWRLADVLILAFGGVVLATALRALARALERRLSVPDRASTALATLLVIGVLAGLGWVLGDALADQLAALRERLPQAAQALQRWLARTAIGRQLIDAVHTLWSEVPGAQLAAAAGLTLGAAGSALLLAVVGVYLAADPRLYRRGLLRLAPPAQRARLQAALDDAGHALGRWLLGQGLSMVFLGVATTLGLWLLEAPLALALGLITALFAFVPFFGALAAGLLAVLLAFTEGPRLALYVALMFIAVQQIEEIVVLPLVHRWTVALPPVLGVIAALVFGHLFGLLGVVFATPAMVVAIVLVRELYVEGLLETGERPLDPARDRVRD